MGYSKQVLTIPSATALVAVKKLITSLQLKPDIRRVLCLGALSVGLCSSLHASTFSAQSEPPKDDLLWLESPHDVKAVAWAKQHTNQTMTRLRALPDYPQVKAELAQLLENNLTQQPDVVLLGHRAIRALRNREHPFGLLQVAERGRSGLPERWRTVLDLADLRKREDIPYELHLYGLDGACLPPRYSRCLLRLSPGGGDEVEIREFDLDRGQFVPNGFRMPKARNFVEWLNQDLLMIANGAAEAPRSLSGYTTVVQLWHRGQPLGAAKTVYAIKPSDALFMLNAAGSGASRYGVIVRAITLSQYELYTVDQRGQVAEVQLPESLKSFGVAAVQGVSDHALLVQLGQDAELEGKSYPAESLLAYRIDPSTSAGPHVSLVYIPKPGEFVLTGMATQRVHERFSFVATRQLVPALLQAIPDGGGWVTHKVLQGEAGQTLSVVGTSGANNDIVVKTTGLTTPTRQDLYRSGQPPRLLARDSALIDAGQYTIEVGSAPSKDGTSVDYYLLKPKVPLRHGPQPLLVMGYGLLGCWFPLDYFGTMLGGPVLALWLSHGGSLVIPAARGGGERGEAWHQAATRERRQNSYDDFIAVTEKLVRSGYTAHSKIGVAGKSGGGLLAAVLGTERPDLFGAVVSDVPLTDLLRMKEMGVGGDWLSEFGDAADPVMAKVLGRYSPYQNVRSGTRYPPFMITTSTADSRVGPGHARKLAARLESVGGTVYFYEDAEGGHDVSDALRNQQLLAMRMSFLIDALMKN
jgi:prolyl oligopeptidase